MGQQGTTGVRQAPRGPAWTHCSSPEPPEPEPLSVAHTKTNVLSDSCCYAQAELYAKFGYTTAWMPVDGCLPQQVADMLHAMLSPNAWLRGKHGRGSGRMAERTLDRYVRSFFRRSAAAVAAESYRFVPPGVAMRCGAPAVHTAKPACQSGGLVGHRRRGCLPAVCTAQHAVDKIARVCAHIRPKHLQLSTSIRLLHAFDARVPTLAHLHAPAG